MKKYLPQFFSILSIISPFLAARMALKLFATPTRVPRPESEMENFKKSKKYFLKNGFAAFEWGNPNDPIVLLIHGWNGRGTQMAFIQETLVEKGFRVIALDGPGHGDSPGKETNPVEYANFIISSQNELSPEGIHAIMAHSFGGGCAALAIKMGLKTNCIALVASPNEYSKVVDNYLAMIKLSKAACASFMEQIQKLTGIKPHDLVVAKIMNEVALPLFIAHDYDDDAVSIKAALKIKEDSPRTRLLTTKGLGHRRILKSPHVIGEISDFIQNIKH